MNSLHDAVQSRNGPAEAAANGERNADGDVGWPCYAATAADRRPPGLSVSLTAALALPKFVALSVSVGSYIYLFITQNNLTEFVSFILTQCGINIKRKVVLLLDLLF